VTSDAECLEANVDFGSVSGYVVRLDVEIPADAMNGSREDGGPMGHLLVTPDEAERLAQLILARAAEVRALRQDRGPGQGDEEV
jgi:hypothetical protein